MQCAPLTTARREAVVYQQAVYKAVSRARRAMRSIRRLLYFVFFFLCWRRFARPRTHSKGQKDHVVVVVVHDDVRGLSVLAEDAGDYIYQPTAAARSSRTVCSTGAFLYFNKTKQQQQLRFSLLLLRQGADDRLRRR